MVCGKEEDDLMDNSVISNKTRNTNIGGSPAGTPAVINSTTTNTITYQSTVNSTFVNNNNNHSSSPSPIVAMNNDIEFEQDEQVVEMMEEPNANTTTDLLTQYTNNLPSPQVIILDAGAQYGKLIDRRIRELNIHSELVPLQVTAKQLAKLGAK